MAKCSVIILAAGKGTRMKSETAKVLHPIAGKPMLQHVIAAAAALKPESITIVLSPGSEAIQHAAIEAYADCQFAVQHEQLGTGHAVKCGMEQLAATKNDVLVVYGDTPLVTAGTLSALLAKKQKAKATIALAGIYLDDPTGYGRLVMKKQPFVEQIVEQKDASSEIKKIQWGWGGIMAFSADFLRDGLEKMRPSKATGEYYLTELLALSTKVGQVNLMVPMDVSEAMGVNDRIQLAAADAVMQTRLRQAAMLSGVTMLQPETVYVSSDTKFGKDVTVHPHVVFGPGASVASGAEIKSFSHIERASIGKNAIVGPYARLRPGTVLAEGVRIGNFVEIKKANIGKGAKINHLSYVGDAEIGEDVNIGAGTITCNYDGVNKYQTTIEAGAFIGSNTSLVAPIIIGKDALIGAGSVITKNVPAGSLALGRGNQVIKMKKKKTKS